VWSIATATGWSVRYILWGVSFAALLVMVADAPRYAGKKTKKISSKEELRRFLDKK
jgi:hypothetical protein